MAFLQKFFGYRLYPRWMDIAQALSVDEKRSGGTAKNHMFRLYAQSQKVKFQEAGFAVDENDDFATNIA